MHIFLFTYIYIWTSFCPFIRIYFPIHESFRFHNRNFDEIRCKLDSTENPRSFEKYPTPPYASGRTKFALVKSLDSEHDSLAKSVDSHFRVAGPHTQFVTNDTIHMRYTHHTH